MNIFLESVSIEEIRNASAAGFADGVVFSEGAFADSSPGNDPRETIAEIAKEFAIPVCVEVGAISSDDLYYAAHDLAKISDHVVVQLPLVEDALPAMHRLSAEGVGVCATYVFNGAQAVLASKAGASMVRISLHDLDAQGQITAQRLRFATPSERERYYTHILLYMDIFKKQLNIDIDFDQVLDEFSVCLSDQNFWVEPGMHYLVLKKK